MISVESQCRNDNGRCSTFCLAKPNGVTVCSCEDGVKLRADGKTCENGKSPKLTEESKNFNLFYK